jgi:hypothetical protein
VIASSHAMTLEQNSEKLRFVFDPIVLPAAQNDEPGSHGFVKYSVRLRPGLGLGTGVSNTAHIYFDFNPAIVTNTVSTRVVSPEEYVQLTSVEDPIPGQAGLEQVQYTLYPNPVRDRLSVRASGPVPAGSMLIFSDMTGREQFRAPLAGTETELALPGLPGGLYLCRVVAGDKVLATGRVVVE